jgi:hypothetical protein
MDNKGIACDCGNFHKFPPYVYAHTRDVLEFTCPVCGQEWEVIRLKAWKKEWVITTKQPRRRGKK